MGLQQYYIAQSLILEIVIMADNADFLANSHSPLIPCLQNPNHVYKRKQKAEKKNKTKLWYGAKAACTEKL